jgi:hypothetical protein
VAVDGKVIAHVEKLTVGHGVHHCACGAALSMLVAVAAATVTVWS